MPENRPLTPSQRAANERKAKEASERVKQSEAERENINPGGLGALAAKVAEERKKKAAAEAQKKALKDQ